MKRVKPIQRPHGKAVEGPDMPGHCQLWLSLCELAWKEWSSRAVASNIQTSWQNHPAGFKMSTKLKRRYSTTRRVSVRLRRVCLSRRQPTLRARPALLG